LRIVNEPVREVRVYTGPSKSQRKRDSHAMQDLGETLVALPMAKLRALPLPDALIEAIEMAQRITSREGRRRQLQLVGKLMRNIDPEPIRDFLDKDGSKHREDVGLMHSAEHWRERLLDDPAALAQLAAQHPSVDSPSWRTLIEAARGEKTATQPGRRYRELYRALREVLAGGAAADHASAEGAADEDGDDDADVPSATHRKS
jgi:ribosome-associated protein